MLSTPFANKIFSEYIMTAIDNREKLIIMNRGLQIEIIHNVVSIFSRSINVSIMNERTHFLLRN